jgi:hypothetical protein
VNRNSENRISVKKGVRFAPSPVPKQRRAFLATLDEHFSQVDVGSAGIAASLRKTHHWWRRWSKPVSRPLTKEMKQ